MENKVIQQYIQIIENENNQVTQDDLIKIACGYIHKHFSAAKAQVECSKYRYGFYTDPETEKAIVREVSKALETFAHPVSTHATVVLGFDRTIEEFIDAWQHAWKRSALSGGYPFSAVSVLEVKPKENRQELIGNGREFRNDGQHYEIAVTFDAGTRGSAQACAKELDRLGRNQIGHTLLDNETAFKFGDAGGRYSNGSIKLHHISESDVALLEGLHHLMYCAKSDPAQKGSPEYVALLDEGYAPFVTTETKRGRRAVLEEPRRRRNNRWIEQTVRPQRPAR
jgi:hypothetical protein